jgi:death-on-curing protein
MSGFVWIEKQAIILLHDRSLALHGGGRGIRDEGLLEAALQRPQNLNYYDGVTDVSRLAAAYAVAVSGNHPFVDGNKRAAFHCLALFLRLNGARLTAGQADAALTILALAAGRLDLDQLTEWVKANSTVA